MTLSNSWSKRRLSFIASIALGLCSSAVSQEKALGKENVAEEEFVIIGEKLGRSLQETTSSVKIFSAEDLKRSAAETGYDLYDRTANVSGFSQNNITIRGYREQGENGASKAINTYIDGVVVNGQATHRGFLSSLWDVKQVEIYRGAQSTTQGRDSIAGAVVIETNDPTYEWEGAMRLGIAEYDTMQQAIAFGGPIIDDTLAFRVSYDDQSTDGFITNTALNRDDIDKSLSRNLRIKLRWDPVEDLSFILSYNKIQAETGTPQVDLDDPFARKRNDPSRAFGSDRDADLDVFSLKSTLNINDDWFFTSISSYSEQSYETVFPASTLLLSQLQGPPAGIRNPVLQDSTAYTQEFRLNYDNGEDLRAIAGLYMYKSDENTKRYYEEQLVPATIPIPPMFGGPITIPPDGANGRRRESRDVESIALFGELDYDVNDLWTVNIGGRVVYEKVDASFEDRSLESVETYLRTLHNLSTVTAPFLFPGGPVGIAPSEDFASRSDSTDEVVFLPKLGVTLHAADNVDISATVQRAYRSGGLSGQTNEYGVATSVVEYDPEYSWNYELALRSHWFDQQLFFNANVFYVDYDDQQVSERVEIDPTTTLAHVTNAGKSHKYGAEVELTYRPLDLPGFEIYANFGWLETHYDDYVDGEDDYSGNDFIRAPNFTGALGVSYFHNSGVFGSIEGSYRDNTYSDTENTRGTDSHIVVDAKLGYTYDEKYTVYVFGRNLFDEEYLEDVSSSYAIIGAPQTFGVMLDVKF